MSKTKQRLSKYWDRIMLKRIPPYGRFKKIEGEINEHFNFIKWMFKRVLVPLMVFYVTIGLILNMNVFGSLFLSFLVFVYSNFLPDIDFLIKKTKDKNKDSLWYEKYLLLFFAPVIMYYIIGGRAKPLYSIEDRSFHNLKTVIAYGIFLFVIGSIFWTDALKRLMLPIFGMLGFVFHLMVDKEFNNKLR
jgi:hypothetical protein